MKVAYKCDSGVCGYPTYESQDGKKWKREGRAPQEWVQSTIMDSLNGRGGDAAA